MSDFHPLQTFHSTGLRAPPKPQSVLEKKLLILPYCGHAAPNAARRVVAS